MGIIGAFSLNGFESGSSRTYFLFVNCYNIIFGIELSR
jgi:hypothetical protein